MQLLAKEFDMPSENGLPLLTYEQESRFNKSKIQIGSQWMSHPSNKDRIDRLISLNLPNIAVSNAPAMTLLANAEKTQQEITAKLFMNVKYEGTVVNHSSEEFEHDYTRERQRLSFAKLYHNYFDDTDLTSTTIPENADTVVKFEPLFDADKIELVYNALGIESDIKLLKQIRDEDTGVKSFDYDGRRYKKRDIASLIPTLEKQLQEFKSEVDNNNKLIVAFFHQKALRDNKASEYTVLLNSYVTFKTFHTPAIDGVNNIFKQLQFIKTNRKVDEIQSHFRRIYPMELKIKELMQGYISDVRNKENINNETLQKIELYLSKNYSYISNQQYNQYALGILFDALRLFAESINNQLFKHKKDFLDFQAALVA